MFVWDVFEWDTIFERRYMELYGRGITSESPPEFYPRSRRCHCPRDERTNNRRVPLSVYGQ